MNIQTLREKFIHEIEARNLSYSEVERRSGLSRASLRNFLNGHVKEPRAEMILAVASFLNLELRDLLKASQITIRPDPYKVQSPTPYNKSLFLECSQGLMTYLITKNESISLEETFDCLKKIYEYCLEYHQGQFEPSFVQWCVDHR
jgi:transcriptional regulator with XRE-family HTH domain